MKGLILFLSIGIAWFFGSSMLWGVSGISHDTEISQYAFALWVFSFAIFPLGIIFRNDDVNIKKIPRSYNEWKLWLELDTDKKPNFTGVKQ